ncbi:hypothetical protein KCP75_14970 [Salmonella enterica subsp. enterica]|nr:hypothetical protein KCP75_14970 [Salmonella enterica subsp. enterica]
MKTNQRALAVRAYAEKLLAYLVIVDIKLARNLSKPIAVMISGESEEIDEVYVFWFG